MIAVSQTKSANYLFIVAVLKSMRDGGLEHGGEKKIRASPKRAMRAVALSGWNLTSWP